MFQGKEKYSWNRERENEWAAAAGPFIPGRKQLAHFRTFFYFTFVRARFFSTWGKIKKERKTLQIFSFFPIGYTHWRMAFHWKGDGWLDCQLPSSFALLVYTDRYMASTTLYNSSLLLYVVWLFSLSPSFSFPPPRLLPTWKWSAFTSRHLFFTLKGSCALANNKTSTSSPFFNEAIHCCIQGQVYNPSTHTHRNVCNALNRKRGC